ncbi:MAG TPA: PDZ domain-containing protein [Candidatus Acidoferrales bacterium]|nr:PDZ domain-containing protein [Candidatus Acidoferrales bacterium]
MRSIRSLVAVILAAVCPLIVAAQASHPLLQRPTFNGNLIVFSYAGDLWTVDRSGGHASRLTTGTGIETDPVFSPDGTMIAFTGEYDGNTDVFVVPASGGVPKRLTYHPTADAAVGWTPDGKYVIFRSNRESGSPRYTKLFKISIDGGLPTALPLPMAFSGKFSPDGKYFAYSPVGGASPFNYSAYVAWRNYRGGLASSVWIADMGTLDVVKIPRERSNDFNPLWVDKQVYFLSDRNGPVSLFRFDPATKSVTEVVKNDGADIRSASAGTGGIVYDRFGELFLYDTASGKTNQISVDVSADLPDVRARISPADREIQSYGISPTGVRAVFEAHGDILTVPAKESTTRDITNTPGVMERDPAWSPDGQSIAYFSDESGQYALHISSQTGSGEVKKFPLANDATFYFQPTWSPDSKLIAFHDNKAEIWLLDTVTGKATVIGKAVVDDSDYDASWSADSKWLAYTQTVSNRFHALFFYSVESGKSTQISDGMSDVRLPAFDRGGKYLYFTESTNYGTTTSGLDMSSDAFNVTRSVYGLALAADTASPVAPQAEDEKKPDAKDKDAKDKKDSGDSDKDKDKSDSAKKSDETAKSEKGEKPAEKPKPVKVDLDRLEDRAVALPLPPGNYAGLTTGKEGILHLLEGGGRFDAAGGLTLSRYDLKTKKPEKLADHIAGFDLSFDGNKMLLEMAQGDSGAAQGAGPARAFVIVPADAPVKPGEGRLDLSKMEVRVDPRAEWRQMFHEIWQIERSFFYDPHYHGVNTVADEAKFKPFLDEVGSRSDLNYLFQEMLGAFSIGHLRGFGGTIPRPNHVAGGLLGADFEIVNGRYRIKRIYTGEHWNPQAHAPLTEPGVKVSEGDFILAIGGQDLSGSDDIQRRLEGTAGTQVVLKIAADANGKDAHDVTVTPIGDDLGLRNLAWIEANRRKVQDLSGGKLAYVYLPDTGLGGLTNFNRYYFAQLDKQGAVIDERFNGGGQAADYIINAMQRTLMSWWAPRYGAIYRTPQAAILGPKVMIINEYAGSGGDAMPWYFREAKLGPLVGKRTWGGLVGIGGIPTLMDGGQVTSPSFGFFNPQGQWDVENHGVPPDYEVDMEPKPVSEGHDPQLEKAVSLALEELAKNPVPEPHKPEYPNYNRPAAQ